VLFHSFDRIAYDLCHVIRARSARQHVHSKCVSELCG
jgi:hypothetical protein